MTNFYIFSLTCLYLLDIYHLSIYLNERVMKESKSKYAVMGILSIGPVSGYDIKKKFEKSLSYFWSESYGQIYPILKRLATEGLAIRSIQKQTGKPDRHIYALTDKGRKALREWMIRPVGRLIGRHEILLKLFFGHQVSLEDNIRQVEHFRELQSEKLKEIIASEEMLKTDYKDNPNLTYWLMTLRYGQYINRAYLRWCDETLAILKGMEQEAGA
ncbi:MAG: PadR family transcriptional regulator [Deltaproteobacteria bacterium]|nr:PadR family transcriptional regulator [Deltaproteobacteria bacterium]MBW2342447.1 PadR family transcriptional regulator [Deltaproteobacteria bacterium]